MSQRTWIGGVRDGQPRRLRDLAGDHLDGILIRLEYVCRRRVCGNGRRRDGRRLDIDTGGRHHVDKLATRALRELHRGCCRGAGEHQPGLRRRRGIALGNRAWITAVEGGAGRGCSILARAVVAGRKRGEQRAERDAAKKPVSHYIYWSTSQRPGRAGFLGRVPPSNICCCMSTCRTSVTARSSTF